jgi:protein kinase N
MFCQPTAAAPLQSIEEKVKNGANNLLVAYSKSSAKSDPTMQLHATDMLSEAMSKIEFLKTEIIRQDQAAAAIGGVFEQADRALAARYTLEQRRNEVVHRMLVEALVHDGAEKLVAKGRANGKAALSAARKRAEESASKLELLMQANDVLKAVDMSSASNPIEFLVPRTSQLVSGCLTIHVVQAEGLIRDVSGRRSRFRPFVVATIGNDVTAQTSACRKPGETPKWSETLTLRFTRERECELQCFSSKGAMCGLQYLQLEDLLDGESHAVRVPLEPQGTLWLNLSFANVLVVRPPAQGLSRTREMRVKKQQGRRLARAAELGIGVAPWARLVREGGAEVPAMRTPQQPVASPRLLTVAGGSSIQYSRTSPAGGSASKPPRFELNSPDPRGSLALSPISRHVGSPPLYKGGTEAAAAGGAGSHTLQMSDFHVLRLLGKGHFGKVLLAQRKGTNQLAAVKCIRKSEVLSRDELDSMTTERNVFRAVNKGRSSFLLRLYGAFQTESHICFAMEYCPGGDLLAQIQRDGVFDGPRARFYTACVVLAMRFLHQRSIIYRDLKLDNVLIDGRGYARLADYGLCKEHVGCVCPSAPQFVFCAHSHGLACHH